MADPMSQGNCAEVVSHIENLERQVAQLQAQSVPSTSHTSAFLKTKVPRPQPFHGKRYQVKPFISGLRIYISLRSHEFPNEMTKLLFAASLLRDTAYDWFRPYETAISTGTAGHSGLVLSSIDDFYEQITNVFGDPDESLTAATKLYKLIQLTSVATYTSEFQRLSSQLSWNEEALKDLYYQGLKPAIKDNILRGVIPTTLSEMIRIASNFDNRFQQYKTNLNRNNNRSWQASRQVPVSEPMELDAIRTNPAPKQPSSPSVGKRLSRDERQHRISNNLCLYCGKSGHQVKNCHSAKSKQPSRPKNNRS